MVVRSLLVPVDDLLTLHLTVRCLSKAYLCCSSSVASVANNITITLVCTQYNASCRPHMYMSDHPSGPLRILPTLTLTYVPRPVAHTKPQGDLIYKGLQGSYGKPHITS